jgi:CRP/FNR family nitrogen fixation transcriptional regulator
LRSYKRSALAVSDTLKLRAFESLQRQLEAAHDHTVSLGRKTAEERICTLILRLQEQSGGREAVSLPMSRTEIADYLGLTLETVCRTLSDLTRRKLVETGSNRSEIRVPDAAHLRRAARAA